MIVWPGMMSVVSLAGKSFRSMTKKSAFWSACIRHRASLCMSAEHQHGTLTVGSTRSMLTSQLYRVNCMVVVPGVACDAMLAFCSADASSELSCTTTVLSGWQCTCRCRHNTAAVSDDTSR